MNFKASKGWLKNFIERKNIHKLFLTKSILLR